MTKTELIDLLVGWQTTHDVTFAHLLLQCSRRCGGTGEQTRLVWCASDSGDATADERCDRALKPSDRRDCDTEPCVNISWAVSQWSEVCQSAS